MESVERNTIKLLKQAYESASLIPEKVGPNETNRTECLDHIVAAICNIVGIVSEEDSDIAFVKAAEEAGVSKIKGVI